MCHVHCCRVRTSSGTSRFVTKVFLHWYIILIRHNVIILKLLLVIDFDSVQHCTARYLLLKNKTQSKNVSGKLYVFPFSTVLSLPATVVSPLTFEYRLSKKFIDTFGYGLLPCHFLRNQFACCSINHTYWCILI